MPTTECASFWVNRSSRERATTGPKFSFATPPHQDYFFYRPVTFCTVWIPLMDIDESVGGLTLRQGSHRQGLYQTWWKGTQFLGAAQSREQSRQWQQAGGVPVAGENEPGDGESDKPWLRSDFRIGDVLIVDPLMMHVGVPNHSNLVRLSADFRYQPRGTVHRQQQW